MAFWGFEVKPGVPLKVKPEAGRLVHISQAALGEVKDVKGAKNVPLRLKIDTENYIIGTLSAQDRPQLQFDLVFEREFEISHDWKNGSVYLMGYIAADLVSDEENFSDESEDEPDDILQNGTIEPKVEDIIKPAKSNATAAKIDTSEDSESDEDDEDSDSDEDGPLEFGGPQEEDSSDVSTDSDSEEDSEEETPKKVEQPKKRSAEFAQGTPVSAKKAKSATPGNKNVHIATPYPSKRGGKTQRGGRR